MMTQVYFEEIFWGLLMFAAAVASIIVYVNETNKEGK